MIDLSRWTITDAQVEAVTQLTRSAAETELYQTRVNRNIEGQGIELDRDIYWETLVMAVLTTRQESGPGTLVDKFLNLDEFPLSLHRIPDEGTKTYVQGILADNGLPGKRKGRYVAENYHWFQNGGDTYIDEIGTNLGEMRNSRPERQIACEVRAATALQPFALGIGPKQSRNFWQALGLTQWEAPLDKRVLNWLRNMPDTPPEVNVSKYELSDERTYRVVMSWIQALAVATDEVPCCIDAAVFTAQQ